jgi:hypothetical protein
MKLYWITHCGQHAIERTRCMVETEFFTHLAKSQHRLRQIVRLHKKSHEQVESYTYGDLDLGVQVLKGLAHG